MRPHVGCERENASFAEAADDEERPAVDRRQDLGVLLGDESLKAEHVGHSPEIPAVTG